MPLYYEWTLCSELNLGYVHIFKAGGTTARLNLSAHCTRMGGVPSVYAHYLRPRRRVPDASFPPANFSLYTFVRDPIDRFFSAYHEVRMRQLGVHVRIASVVEQRQRKGKRDGLQEPSLDAAAAGAASAEEEVEAARLMELAAATSFTKEEQRRDIDGCIDSLRFRPKAARADAAPPDWQDPHLRPQRTFVRRLNGAPLPVAAFAVGDMSSALAWLYDAEGRLLGTGGAATGAEALAAWAAAAVAALSGDGPDGDSGGGLEGGGGRSEGGGGGTGRLRDRRSDTYRIPRYSIELADLSSDNVRDLCVVYAEDYCHFGLVVASSPCAPHAALVNETCLAGGIAWGTAALRPVPRETPA